MNDPQDDYDEFAEAVLSPIAETVLLPIASFLDYRRSQKHWQGIILVVGGVACIATDLILAGNMSLVAEGDWQRISSAIRLFAGVAAIFIGTAKLLFKKTIPTIASPVPRVKRQFNLLTWFTGLTIWCVLMGVSQHRYVSTLQLKRQRDQTIRAIGNLGGQVEVHTAFNGRSELHITLAGTRLKGADLAKFLPETLAISLNLGATDITNADMAAIARCRNLRSLILSGTNIDDEGISQLSNLKLHELRLRKTNVTGTGLKALNQQRIEKLDLSLCPVSYQGLQSLAGMSHLRNLSLSETKIGDNMIPLLLELENLWLLDLKSTNFSDEGLLRLRQSGTVIASK